MIKSYRDSKVKRLYEGENIKAWTNTRRQAEKRLSMLDAADRLETLMLFPVIALKPFTATERANTASASTIAGEYVLLGH